VELELAETVSTRTIKRGDTFALKLAAPLIVDGRVLIPAGVAGVGQVVDAGKPGLGGRPAKLVLAARRLEFDGRQAPLRGFFLGGTGADNTEATGGDSGPRRDCGIPDPGWPRGNPCWDPGSRKARSGLHVLPAARSNAACTELVR
jgi:hypothetical protein